MTGDERRVPFLDLERRWRRHRDAVQAGVDRVLGRGVLLGGPEVEAFEESWAAFAGCNHAVAVASGTEALRIALVAAGVGPGDEVIVPAMTAVPTAAAVCATGATPVFADVDPATGLLDSEAAARAVTDRTAAVVPVHLYGRPCPVPDLGVPVVEDAAQAHGALTGRSSPRTVATAYSFYPTKNLGGIGDGGAVVADDPAIVARVRALRGHGLVARSDYRHDVIAGNSRLSEIEAAALQAALATLADDTVRRREIAGAYRDAAPSLDWQSPHDDHVYHLCVVRVPDRESQREAWPFGTAVHYARALTQQPAYAQFVRDPCPNAEAWAASCVSLPCFPELTDDEVELVCKGLAACN